MKRLLPLLSLFAICCSFNAAANITFDGLFEQGALVRAKVAPDTKVWLNNEPLMLTPDGELAFGFAREAALKQELKLKLADGSEQVIPLKIKSREYKIQRVNGIAKKIMKPDPKAVARSRQDSKQVKTARGQFTDNQAFMQDFIWPLTGRISGVYGSQRVYNGKPGTPHYGVDVAAKTGTVIVAPADGTVSLAVADMFYSGGTIIVDHGYGVSSSFLHLSKLYVAPGDFIAQGQPIGEVGATGRATGPHLDWRLNWYQMRLDPVSIVPSMASVLSGASKIGQ
ncbi:M23 family metallopeptidase [Shewanella gelidii]|uniref:Periplasmic metalloprotease M23B family protein n=1 Tax=Shewanella gelidii TaxID=1642821 RepID=A0A917ND53_9GAMM|nr:M23 family metallopeptidase [Shewanella gelidii]MCL1098670.1 M23 family metallopeptidase [Shewanella gelidii]GGI86191.1 periplasmic metalloprotease M23B family protein [Shewanella gelidii]